MFGASQQLQQIVLCAAGLGKDDSFPPHQFIQFFERHLEGLQQCRALGVFGDKMARLRNDSSSPTSARIAAISAAVDTFGAAIGDGISSSASSSNGLVSGRVRR